MGSVSSIAVKRCGLCTVKLEKPADIARGVCDDCKTRPEARRRAAAAARPAAPTGAARPFTVADKALIRSVHHLMPAVDLLRTLNTRLIADLGAEVPRYSMEQLQAEIATIPVAATADDWTALRRLLNQARRDGVLEQITPQVIQDFAVVFKLSSAQLLGLKDVIRHAKERG